MLSINTLLLLQDYMEYEDFRSLSDAHYINTPETIELIESYCLLDLSNKLGYLIDRMEDNMKDIYCKLVLEHKAIRCLNMLIKRDKSHITTMVSLIYKYDMLDMFNYLIENGMSEYFSTLILNRNNKVLEGIVELYSNKTLYSSSLLYDLEQLRRYDLIDKVLHVYY